MVIRTTNCPRIFFAGSVPGVGGAVVAFHTRRHSSTNFSNSSAEGVKKVVIVGSGTLAQNCVVKALSLRSRVIVCTSKNKQSDLREVVGKLKYPAELLSFFDTCYEQGRDQNHWRSFFREISKGASEITVLNTRGISTLPKGLKYEDIFQYPAEALMKGFCEGASEKVKRVYVNLSSSAASIPRFPEINPYARVRQTTDLLLEKIARDHEIFGGNLRCDLVLNPPRSIDSSERPNHGYSPVDFAKGFFQVVLGHPDILAIQPLIEDDLVEVALGSELKKMSYSTVDAVGPDAYTQREVYTYFCILLQIKKRMVEIPFSVGDWAKVYIPKGQLTYGGDLLKLRHDYPECNHPLDHKPFQKLAKRPLTCMKCYYGGIGDMDAIQSPLSSLVVDGVRTIFTNPIALRDFLRGPVLHVPGICRQVASTLVSSNRDGKPKP